MAARVTAKRKPIELLLGKLETPRRRLNTAIKTDFFKILKIYLL